MYERIGRDVVVVDCSRLETTAHHGVVCRLVAVGRHAIAIGGYGMSAARSIHGGPLRRRSARDGSWDIARALAARGESLASHRDGRGAPSARRDDREYREYLREEPRSQRGCIARRMQPDFFHGLLDERSRDGRSAEASRYVDWDLATHENDDRGDHQILYGGRLSPAGPIVQSQAVRIAIGADHAGFLLKQHLKETLERLGHTVDDRGTTSEAPVDYPPICFDVAGAVADGRADRGIVLGGSGQGEQMAANKVAGARAALCNDLYTARLSRQHNDANVLSMGGRIVAFGLADEIVALWLDTPFDGGRHQRRLDQIAAAERLRT